jgi:galactokinase
MRDASLATLPLIHANFGRLFGGSGPAAVCRAPGRVNLIGEHTDYNAGYVMPVAIALYTYAAVRARSDGRLRVHSTNFDETVELEITAEPGRVDPGMAQHWSDYVWGVAHCLLAHGGALPGADLLIHGEVPLGAGLSSSAALEMAAALALMQSAGRSLEPLALATLCQRAENESVGSRCGIMDPFTAAFGREGYALCLDCRSLAYRTIPLEAPIAPDVHRPPGSAGESARLVICNTMVRHQLAAGEYNKRREECERGVAALARLMPRVQSLRDVTLDELVGARTRLEEVIFRRCRHVVTENARVVSAATALESRDFPRFGQLMRESHSSLCQDYEVSCAELDLMVRLALECDSVYGARMTGGGFGGCTVNLVREDAVERFGLFVAERYSRATGRRPEIYVCESADGASRLMGPPGAEQSWQRISPA